MKKLLIIIFLIAGLPFIVFKVDIRLRKSYENPFRVGKAFSYSYMIKDSEHMKSWADKKIYKNIDELKYSTPIDGLYEFYWEYFELVSSCKIGNTLVCTYMLDVEDTPLFYSAVLKPTGQPSLWERFRNFICWRVPFANDFFGFKLGPYNKWRWLVVDFFTNNDFEKYISKPLEVVEKEELDWNILEVEIKQMEDFENKWSNREKIQQNTEMKELYMDYLKGTERNNK